MKLEARQIDSFLRNPSAFRCVLLHGEDEGLIRYRAAELAASIAGSANDPFRVSHLNRDEHKRVLSEMTAIPLTGGRRVVLIHEATDAITPSIRAALSTLSDSFLVIEAGLLTARSTLRALIEREHNDAASIACYREDGPALERTIRKAMTDFGVTIDADAVVWLRGKLGNDRGATEQELAKIALYVGPGNVADLSALRGFVGDLADLQVEDALFCATEGDVAGADRAIALAMGEGVAAVSVLRASLAHLQRLHRVRIAVDGGSQAIDAVRSVRPPVFIDRRVRSLTNAVRLWNEAAILAACDFIFDVERQCKKSGIPAAVLSQRAIGLIARSSRSKRDSIAGYA